MVFPVVASVGADYISAATTSHVIDLPDSIASGDLLIAFFTRDGSTGTVTFPAGLPWTALTGPADAGTSQHYVQYRVAGGSEGTSITVATSASEEGCAKILRITGWHGSTPPAQGTVVTGTTSQNPDPPILNPADWDVEDTLWIAWFGCNGQGAVSACPTDYTSNQVSLSQTACAMGLATRELAAASDDPGTFTKAGNTPWSANTFAVRPAAGISGDAALTATATLTATGSLLSAATASLTGIATVTASAAATRLAAAALTGTATVTAEGDVISGAPALPILVTARGAP